jgi:hypothetical protein
MSHELIRLSAHGMSFGSIVPGTRCTVASKNTWPTFLKSGGMLLSSFGVLQESNTSLKEEFPLDQQQKFLQI